MAHASTISTARRRAIRLAPLLALALGGCSQVLDPQGPIAASEKTILLNSLFIMLCIIVPVIVGTLGFAWWYRAGNKKARYLSNWAYSGRIELVVWAVPILTIMFLGGIAWISSHDLDPFKPLPSKQKAIDVEVVSLDWKWLFLYPGQNVATVNQLAVPVGVPIHFHITSASVMNAFDVPQLGGMIYAMNGMATQLYLQADKPGRYLGLSTHYSGDGFSGMRFAVDAMPPARFAQWLQQAHARGAVLDRASYEQLAQQSKDVKPYSYRAVQPGLFQAILTQAIPPAPGPHMGQGGPGVTPRSES